MNSEVKSNIDMTKSELELEVQLRHRLFDELVEDYNTGGGVGSEYENRLNKISTDSIFNKDDFLFGCKGQVRWNDYGRSWVFYFLDKTVIVFIPRYGSNYFDYFKVVNYGSTLTDLSIYDVSKIVFKNQTDKNLEKETINSELVIDLDLDKLHRHNCSGQKWYNLPEFQLEIHTENSCIIKATNNGYPGDISHIISTIKSNIRQMKEKNNLNRIQSQMEEQYKLVLNQQSQMDEMKKVMTMMQNQMEEQAKLIMSLQTKKIEEQLNLEAEVDLLLSDDVIGEQLICEKTEEKDEIEEESDKPEDEAEEDEEDEAEEEDEPDEKPKYTIKNSCECIIESSYTIIEYNYQYGKIGYVLRKAKSGQLKCECWYISFCEEGNKITDCYRVKAFTKDIPTEGWECLVEKCECCGDRLDNKSPIVTRKQDKPEANEIEEVKADEEYEPQTYRVCGHSLPYVNGLYYRKYNCNDAPLYVKPNSYSGKFVLKRDKVIGGWCITNSHNAVFWSSSTYSKLPEDEKDVFFSVVE